MTISGEITGRQLAMRRLAAWLVCLVWCAPAILLLLAVLIRHLGPLDPMMIGALAIFPIAGAGSFWAMTRWDIRRVVEFTCDESSFRFRICRSEQSETRALSEVAAVREMRERGGPTGYEVVFRDGRKVFLGRSLPNAKAAAGRLSSQCQP
jgi:hypothetical protein